MTKRKIYLMIVLSFNAVMSVAQSPAGISSGLKLWVKADATATLGTTGALVNSWTYVNDNTKSFTGTGTERPTLTATSLNFLPVLTFGGAQMMSGPTGSNAPVTAGDDDYSVFVVWRSSSVNTYQRIWGQKKSGGGDDGDGVMLATWGDGNYGDQIEKSPYGHTFQRPYSANEWNISQMNLRNQALNDLEIADNRNLSTGILQMNTDNSGINGAAIRQVTDVIHNLGARDDATQEPLTGDVAEIIIYDRSITGTERDRIFSYLSIKYGIAVKIDISNSAGTILWNSSGNSTYNNAVFGLGRDDNGGLLASQSNSLLTGTGNGTGQSGAGNIVLSGASSLDNGDVILIGHNNASLAETASDLPATADGSARRLTREWKVQHTGDVGTINLDFYITGLTISGTPSSATQYRLLVDLDGDGNFTTGAQGYYAASGVAGNKVSFTGAALPNNAVFTIITLASPSGLGANAPNTSTITAPADNATFGLASNVLISATATDPDNNIAKVEFYDGVTKIGEATTAPYSFTWNNVPSGNHALTAKVIDGGGLSLTSAVINISVFNPNWSLTGNENTDASKFLGTTDAQPLVFRTNNTEQMYITADGNIGIGTNEPQVRLDVEGDANVRGQFFVGAYSGQNYLRVRPMETDNSSSLVDFYENTDVANSGFGMFGIANSEWAAPANSIFITSTKSGTGVTKDIMIWANDVPTATNAAMTIKANTGNVGIGTVNLATGAKLTVNGAVYATKIKVSPTGWPDYVFDKKYKLPSLADVEKYIKQHKHLPGITPAAAVEKNGVDVGDNQAALLKKVEELTLYLIEQNKKLEAQQQQLLQQQKRIAAMERSLKKR